jgi:probable addiction module antidote protein
MRKTTEFDPANHLDNLEVIAEYLRLALASGDSELLLSAIGDVEKAKGQIQISLHTDVDRENR